LHLSLIASESKVVQRQRVSAAIEERSLRLIFKASLVEAATVTGCINEGLVLYPRSVAP